MEKEGFGEEFSICSAIFFWRISDGGFGGQIKKYRHKRLYDFQIIW